MSNLNKLEREIFNYKILVKKRTNIYLVSIESLNLFAKGKTFKEATENLEKEFHKLKLHYKNFDILEKINNQKTKYFDYKSIFYFGIKTTIISIATVLSLIFIVSFATNKLSQFSLVELLKSEINKIDAILENKEHNLEKLKKVINKLDPYLKEFHNLNKF